MKTSSFTSGKGKYSYLLLIVLVPCLAYAVLKTKDKNVFPDQSKRGVLRDSIIITKVTTSKVYDVKLYTNASNKVLFFSVNGEENKIYELAIFNQENNKIKELHLHNRQTSLIAQLPKGTYEFHVYSDEEQIEKGNLVVK
ncbi:hypothetical protein [Pinibacter soli]|uniref:Por secretion system C-terminal sorting domain-containing protein n=1 Tax=Pinibacter soli TaxID=3044211 RepID=A0ABT6R777_9BACT|nr:hypothetical protein [Pinibacter soli]MDI3318301.1 hypothetical protein [Pinibacter soli]